ETGFCNLILWRRVFEKFHLAACHSTLLLARGMVERESKNHSKARFPPPVPLPPAKVPVVHLIARELERLDVPGRLLTHSSRDFH
ncbi:MAG TPA: hypothetical protein VGJ84_15040, partial [Polyangiaceae bacterium]